MRWLEYVLFGVGIVGFAVLFLTDHVFMAWPSIVAYGLTLDFIFGETQSHFWIFFYGLLDGLVIAGWIWVLMEKKFNISIEAKEKEKDK